MKMETVIMEQPGQSEEENQSSLDARLEESGLIPAKRSQDLSKSKGDDLVSRLRNAKKSHAPKIRRIEYPEDLGKKVEEIRIGNRQIEYSVKLELMGIDKSPVKKMTYSLIQLGKYLIRSPPERAEDLMESQLERVEAVAEGLEKAGQSFEKRVKEFENYSNGAVFALISKAEKREACLKDAEKFLDLADEVGKRSQELDNFTEKVTYQRAYRKAVSEAQKAMNSITLNNREIFFMADEIGRYSDLIDICNADAYALESISSESKNMIRHLRNIMPFYLDVMRTQRIDTKLKQEVGKLFTYTQNMNRALREGVLNNVNDANSEETSWNCLDGDSLKQTSQEIAELNSDAYQRLESRLAGYLNPKSERRLEE